MNQDSGCDEDITLFSITFDGDEENSAENEGSYVSPVPVQESYVSPVPVQPEGSYVSCENDEELTLLVENCLEDLCLAVGEARNIALIDSACPTTVAGIEWIRSFASYLSDNQRKQVWWW